MLKTSDKPSIVNHFGASRLAKTSDLSAASLDVALFGTAVVLGDQNTLTLTYDKGDKKPKAVDSLLISEVIDIAQNIEQLWVGDDHRDVLRHRAWRNIYDVKNLGFKMIATDGGGETNVSIPATACRHCGLMLPLSIMHVDHQAAKSNSYSGMLKVLKFFGLRTDDSGGYKAQKLANGWKVQFADARTYTPDAGVWNGKGVIFLNVIEALSKRQLLMKACTNSILNLAPRCPRCNTSKGDSNSQSIRKAQGYNAAACKVHHSAHFTGTNSI